MRSRIHPTYKIKYRVTNWAEYEQGLVRRGGVAVWLTPEAIAAWQPVGIGRRGGQLKYSDVDIETALTLRLIFNLPLRQAEGFLASVFGMIGANLRSSRPYDALTAWPAPRHQASPRPHEQGHSSHRR